jgi:hypothetical protein
MLRFRRHACTVAAVIIAAAAVDLHPAATTVTIPCSSASYSLQSHADYTAADCGDLAPLVVTGRTWENSSLSLRNVAFWRLVGGAVGFKFNAATVKNVRITVTGSRFTLNATATAALDALVLAVSMTVFDRVDITFVNTIMQATRTVSGNVWGTLIDSTRFMSSSLSFRNVTCRFDVAVTSGWSASDSAFITVLEQCGTSTSPEILSSSITIENSAFVVHPTVMRTF